VGAVTGDSRPLRRALAAAATFALAVGALVAAPASVAQAQGGDTGIDVPCGDTGALIRAFQSANNAWVNSWVEVNLAPGCTYTLTEPWLGAYADRGQVDPYQGTAHGLPTLHIGTAYSRLILNGNGATIARAEGAARFRFLSLDEFAVAQLHDLTFTNGAAPHGHDTSTTNNEYCSIFIPGDCHAAVGPGQGGGAIYNRGTLTLDNVSFTGNVAGNGENGENGHDTTGGAGGSGGAIDNRGTLTVTGGTFSGNRAGQGGTGGDDDTRAGGNGGNGGDGGAITNYRQLTVAGATFTGNHAGGPGGPGVGWLGEWGSSGEWGGGGAISGSGVTIRGSLFQGNVGGEGTGGEGGAVAVSGGPATVENSTFDANSSGSGGAVAVYSGSLTVHSSTFTGNHDATTQRGADVGFADAGSSLSFTNSVMLDNGVGADCAIGGRGAVSTIGGSTVYSNESPQGIDVPGSDCRATSQGGFALGALLDNGGPTLSRMPTGELLGASEECLASDQRGQSRPSTGCDVGAVERQELASAGTVAGSTHVPAGTATSYSSVGAAGVGLQYRWSVTGVGATIDDPAAASPQITFTEAGEAVVQLAVRISGVVEADGEWTYAPALTVRVGHTPNHAPTITFDAPNSEAAKRQGDTGHYPFTVSDADGDAFSMTGTPSCDAGATRTGWSYDPVTASGSIDCAFTTAPARDVVSVTFTDEWGASRTGYYEVTVRTAEPAITLGGPVWVDAGVATTFPFSIDYTGSASVTPVPSCTGDAGVQLVPGSLQYATSGSVTTGSFQCVAAPGAEHGQARIAAGTVGSTSRSFGVIGAQLQLSASPDLGSMSENGAAAVVTYTIDAHDPGGRAIWLDSADVCVNGTLVSGSSSTLPEGTSTIVCRFGPQNGDYGLRLSAHTQSIGLPTVVTVPFTIIDVPPAVTIVSDAGPAIDEYGTTSFHWTAMDLGLHEITAFLPVECTQTEFPVHAGAVTTGAFACSFGNGPGPASRTVSFSDGTTHVLRDASVTLREVPPVLNVPITPRALRFDQGVVSVKFMWAADLVSEEHLEDVVINWGDGTSTPWNNSIDAPQTHAYSHAGDFDVTVDVTSDGVRLLAVPLDASGATVATIHVTAPPLTISAPASAPEGQQTTVTVPVPSAWAGAYTVDAASCGRDEHGATLPVSALELGGSSFSFACTWRFRDGALQQVMASARGMDGGPATWGSVDVAVVNVAPTLTWTSVPSDLRSGPSEYTFGFTATDPSGVDWLSAAVAPSDTDPDTPAMSCGESGVVVSLTQFDRTTGAGTLGCRFPSGGAIEHLAVTLVDASGARTSFTRDVTVRGTATTLDVTLSPAATVVDEGGTISFGVVARTDAAFSLVDLVTDCGAGNVRVSGPERLTTDADGRASGTVVCRFVDGPSTPVVRVTATSDALSATDAVTIAAADVAPRFTGFSGVQHITGGTALVPLGDLVEPGADTTTLVRLSTSWGYFINFWGGAGVPAAQTLSGIPAGESTVTLTITNEDGVFAQTRVLTTSMVHLTVPGPQIVEATTASGAPAVFPAPTAVDTITGAALPVLCTPMSGEILSFGTSTVSCTATHPNGDSDTETFTVTVRDTTGPVITITPAETGFEAGAGGVAAIHYTVTAVDAVDGAVPATCDVPDGAARGLGDTTIRCTASDSRGNPAVATALVSVVDTTAPVVTAPADLVAEALDSGGADVPRPGYRPPWLEPSSPTATAVDLVDGPVPASCDGFDDAQQAAHFPVGETIVTCTATDSHGNVGRATFTVLVTDTVAPVLTVADQAAEATGPSGASVVFTGLSASDTVDDAPAIDCTPASGSVFAVGVTTVSCAATDAHGNASAPATLTVTVTDTTPPTIETPTDLTAQGLGVGGADTVIRIAATDLVDGELTANCVPQSGTMRLGTLPVTCSATDAHGNTATLDLVFEVGDAAPTLTVPADIAVAAVDASGAPVSFTPTAQDAVDGELTPGCTPVSGSVFPLGTTTVTCTATDSAAHVVTGTFTVTVTDSEAPVLDVPGALIAEATAAEGAALTFTVTATDTVSGAVVPSCDAPSGATFPLGTTTVSCTAADGDGNVGTASFTVTVVDTTAPALTVPGHLAVSTTDPAGAVVPFAASSRDLVDGAGATSCTPASGSVFPVGATTVTCSRTDAAGNRAQASFTVTVGLVVVVPPHPHTDPVVPAADGVTSDVDTPSAPTPDPTPESTPPAAPVEEPTVTPRPVAGEPAPSAGSEQTGGVWVIVGVLLAVTLLGGAALTLRLRRRRG
jgi:hypothetical protein